MSKLFSADEPEDAQQSFAIARGPVLRKNRKKPLHPEEIEARLREKSIQEMPKVGWHWPFGWLLIVFQHDDTKRYRDLPSSFSYEDAIHVRDEEYADEDCSGVMLIRKTYEKK